MRLLVIIDECQQLAEVLALGGIQAAHGESGAQVCGLTVRGTGLERDEGAQAPQAGDGTR